MVESITPNNVAAQIANVHTIFNVATTLLLLPIGTKLVDLAKMILPDDPEDHQHMSLKYLDFSILINDLSYWNKCYLQILNYLMKLNIC